jgi:inhibitor of KinA sporulation pathway (predicted exonuclease)
MNRQELEKQALATVSSDFYYELADSIETMTDPELQALIACDGDYNKEVLMDKPL